MISRHKGPRPSPALVVAVVALVAALAGTAIADPVASNSAISKKKVKKIAKKAAAKAIDAEFPIGGSQIADGAVSGAKIANGAVGGQKLANGAVSGPKLADGVVTSQKLGAITLRTAPDTIAETGDNPDRGEVDCQPGETALAPHMTPLITQDDGDLATTEMTFDPNGATNVPNDQGWIIGISNQDADGDNSSVSVTRGVLCLAG